VRAARELADRDERGGCLEPGEDLDQLELVIEVGFEPEDGGASSLERAVAGAEDALDR
jgi:hypothetical protein